MHDWIRSLAGAFIVFDGPDGSGKTTQFARFATRCRETGMAVCEVREPGGTDIGERVRDLLLDPVHAEMSLRCELMLYMASRAQLVEQVIAPARRRGELVLADRFISSTLAYQGTAGGLEREEILAVGRVAIGDCRPDLTVIFDVDDAIAARRLGSEGAGPSLFSDRMERKGEAFRRRVRQGYLDQAAAEPGRHLVIESAGDEEAVFGELCRRMEQWVGGRSDQ